MILAQEQYTPGIGTRWRCIAGPFVDAEAALFLRLCDYLRETGARTFSMRTKDGSGVELYRLRSECETLDQTRRRLSRYKNNR